MRKKDPRDSQDSIAASQNLPRLARWASGVNALLGAWLLVSPWLTHRPNDYNVGVWPPVLAGAAVSLLGTARYLWPSNGTGLSVANLCLGMWLTVAPWLYNFDGNPLQLWISVLTGLLISHLAVFSICTTHEFQSRRSAD